MLRSVLIPAAALTALLVVGCGGGEPDKVPEPPDLGDGATAAADRAVPADESWKDRESGLPPAGDPRLDDVVFLKTLRPIPEVVSALGDAYLRQGVLDSALVAYDAVLRMEPQNLSALNRKGNTLRRLKRMDEAEAVYQAALELDSYYFDTHNNYGNLFLERGEYELAVREYEFATSIDTTIATVWWNKALAHEKLDQTNPAILSYNKVIECDPEDPLPWEKLGYIYYNRALYKAARERFQEALKRDPSRDDLRGNIKALLDYADSTGTQ